MGLALYLPRVRSSDLLERTCHPFTKPIESLATDLSGGCPTSVTPDRRALAEAGTEDAVAEPAAQARLP
jgi:hypothetical protein